MGASGSIQGTAQNIKDEADAEGEWEGNAAAAKAESTRLRVLLNSSQQAQQQALGEAVSDSFTSVIVVGADGLRDADPMPGTGSSDPYFVVRFGGAGSKWSEKSRAGSRRSEVAQNAGGSPRWNVGMEVVRNVQEMQVRIFDSDWITADDFLGEAIVPLSIESGASRDVDVPLRGKDGAGSGEATGTLKVRIGPPSLLLDEPDLAAPLHERIGSIGKVKAVNVDGITAEGPLLYGKHPLPKTLQGLFWLTGQRDSSALASFGGPTNDGGVCPGTLEKNPYQLRVSGDRTWCFTSPGTGLKLAEAIDLVYKFYFDDLENPTKAQIWPEARRLGELTLNSEWRRVAPEKLAARKGNRRPIRLRACASYGRGG